MASRYAIYATTSKGLPISDVTPAFETDSATSGTVYKRYEDTTDSQFVRKQVTASNVVSEYKAIGAWASRSSLTYVPIND